MFSKSFVYFISSIFVGFPILSNCATSNYKEPPRIEISFPDVGDYDFKNESVAIMSNSNPVFQMLCIASYPVEWIFHYSLEDDGTSEQTKLVETRRHSEIFTDSTTYQFSSKIRLGYKGKILSLTNFTCRGATPWTIMNDENVNIPQTHVIMTAENRKALIVLQITNIRPVTPSRSPEGPEGNCDKAVAATGQHEGFLMPCYRCEQISPEKELELDYIDCISPAQCRSISSRQNKGLKCLRRAKEPPENCKSVNPDFNPKIILCKNFGTALVQFFFFGLYRGDDLDDESIPAPPVYHDWTEVDQQEMIYIHPISRNTVFQGEEILFTCEYSRYYFALGSWFGIQNNGEMKYVKAVDQKPCDFEAEITEKDIRNCTINESWRGTYMAKMRTSFVKVGPHRVFCFGPVWNSTEWINVSLTFDVDEGDPPTVVSLKPDVAGDFIIGQQHRKLVCSFRGKPSPEVFWAGPNNETYFTVQTPNNDTSEILFSEIGYQTAGKYTCTVTSYLGTHTKSYILKSHAEGGSGLSTGGIVSIVVSVLIVTIVVSLVLIRLLRIIKQQREELRFLTEAEVDEFLKGNPGFLKTVGNDCFNKASAIEALPYDEQYEIPADDIVIDYSIILGSGAYGMVLKGKVVYSKVSHYVNVSSSPNIPEDLPVAIKVSKGDLDVSNFKALLSEIKVMAYLGSHVNIVSLIGASTAGIKNKELYIAVEFCPNGSLDDFLKKYKPNFENDLRKILGKFTLWNLLEWTCDIADGLEYIHSKKIIHADMAIRNILLTADLRAKIGDFGLSRQLVDSSSYTKTTKCPLPWRNMAIESLKNLEFSVKSDIWAFGVTLWEMFTLGDLPYPGLNYTVEFTNLLNNGLRLYKPPFVPSSIYEYMLLCWNNVPVDRPGSSDVKVICSKIMNASLPTNEE